MPVVPLMHMRRRAQAAQPAKHSPGEKTAPFLGSASRPPRWARRLLDPFTYDERAPLKYAQVQYSAFADELSKLAYIPNTEGDRAGVLRSLLVALMGKGRFTPTNEPSTDQMAEQNLMYGGDAGRENYAELVQARLSERLLNQSRLRAALEAMEGPVGRVIG